MEKSYNILSFYLIILCISLSAYSLYSNMTNAWLIAPPVYILLVISLIALILGILGFKDKRKLANKNKKLGNGCTFFLDYNWTICRSHANTIRCIIRSN